MRGSTAKRINTTMNNAEAANATETAAVAEQGAQVAPEKAASKKLPGNVVSDVLYGGGVMQNALRLFAGEPVAASALSDDLFAARGFIRQSGPKP
jgi:hypothetical protein